MPDLDGRVIAIAGAAGGLGPLVAHRLAADGATLALTDRDQDRLDSLKSDLSLPDERIDARTIDLLSDTGAVDWASALRDRFSRTDALLHLVGGWRGGDPIDTTPLPDYEFLHDLLVRTVQHTTRAFRPAIASSDHGRFVLVSSTQAQHPSATNASYAAAKAAAEAWTLALADSFRDTPATANILVVNAILTPRMLEDDPGADKPGLTPAEHIADALAFICSDSAARMNGQRLSLHP
jgi:NAD(P)-dependent dehydrogenase (short-subunit alcohol dehydrogenase family)